ncbi:MFS transporter [Gordonia sp. X0973]|uniref:MFS transporter n=1 Tax=Gordonia sp. X0973 TaxID=2742602 RepID=UPI000F52C63B|nr:MFS transporter [Gordonia sp. X0973]QKT06367.1 MFS transporter [Gordonia sp. X0973]
MSLGRRPRSGRTHPGARNYPTPGDPATPDVETAYLNDAHATQNPHLPPLGPTPTPSTEPFDRPTYPDEQVKPGLTRRAARGGKRLTSRGINTIARAATADGADRSGLTALTIPVVANAAVDAAMAVALANTLFFAAASGSEGKVGLYLLLTIAPFALIAPLIGPLLDKLQHGRRIAMAGTFVARAVLAVLIITNYEWNTATQQLEYDPWILYPCALGLLVMSKSFGVLKSAVTPRVVPPSIDLVRVNSRLTTFALIGGTMVGGALAAAFEMLLGTWLPMHWPGGMILLIVIACAGAYFCMKIPSWVEVTAGEIPTTLTYREQPKPEISARERARRAGALISKTIRQPLGRNVVTGLWGNATIRILTGFLTLFVAFYARNQHDLDGWKQMAMLGAVGAAAGVGNVVGNGAGTRLRLTNPPQITVWVVAACLVSSVVTVILPSLITATITAFIASGGSAIGKVCVDSSIQSDLPEASRASAFGRSETVLQLGWVFGATLGVLIAKTTMQIGFGAVSALLALGLAQTFLTSRGRTLIPGFGGGHRPEVAPPTMATEVMHRDPAPRSRPHTPPERHPQPPGPTNAPTRRFGPGAP